VFVRTVVITRDRAGADVDARPNLGIADVGQVVYLAAISDRALLDLDEIAELDAVRQRRTRPSINIKINQKPLYKLEYLFYMM